MSEGTALLIFALLAVGQGAGALFLGWLLGPKRAAPVKMEPYECGVPQMSSSRERFPVAFYLVAILFVIFDIEALFLIPWAVVFKSLGLFGIIEMGVFISILGIGLYYVWKRGGLKWV